MRPIKVFDLDLTGRDEPPAIPLRYGGIRVLIRLAGTALGYLWWVPNDGRDHTRGGLANEFVGSHLYELWPGLVAQGILVEDDADPAQPAIAVIVCVRAGGASLERTLTALQAQRYPLYEVIVVDETPSAETQEIVERHLARYVIEPRPGVNIARNRGLSETDAPIVAFTEDDADPDSGWLAGIAAGFASSSGVEAVSGFTAPLEFETLSQQMYVDAFGGMRQGFTFWTFSRRGRPMNYRSFDLGSAANMAFSREALLEVGGFDPALDAGTPARAGGDADALQRILERGSAVAYRPDAIVWTTPPRTFRLLRKRLFDNAAGLSAAQWAALRRARGTDRVRVLADTWNWTHRRHLGPITRRIFRRQGPGLRLLLADFRGFLLGPLLYTVARRRARRAVPASS
jgi:cellulose synthase/poly-beta-1,6-N-acetylglucosamine synthase-like glycosyltransferase